MFLVLDKHTINIKVKSRVINANKNHASYGSSATRRLNDEIENEDVQHANVEEEEIEFV